MEATDKTKILETERIGKLLWLYAWPAVISQIIASVYNIVDRIFIGQGVGALAIAGLAITMPIMNIIHAFGSLIGVGSSARMSIVLGRKDVNWAEKILGNSMVFTLVLGCIVISSAYLFMDNILARFGATADTISYAKECLNREFIRFSRDRDQFVAAGSRRESDSGNKQFFVRAVVVNPDPQVVPLVLVNQNIVVFLQCVVDGYFCAAYRNGSADSVQLAGEILQRGDLDYAVRFRCVSRDADRRLGLRAGQRFGRDG